MNRLCTCPKRSDPLDLETSRFVVLRERSGPVSSSLYAARRRRDLSQRVLIRI
jgi:hypothetical protein